MNAIRDNKIMKISKIQDKVESEGDRAVKIVESGPEIVMNRRLDATWAIVVKQLVCFKMSNKYLVHNG